MRVSLFAEQLLQPIPGGIGTYTRALISQLPPNAVEVERIVTWHRSSDLFEAGLSGAKRMSTGRRYTYKRWETGRGPKLKGSGDLIHAPSLAVPRPDGRPLVVTVHDVHFLNYPEAYPDRGLEFHTKMVRRLSEAARIIVPSKSTASDLASMDASLPPVDVIPMGTDFEVPDADTIDSVLEKLEVERPYVLWLGTVEPRKNPEGVIHGFVSAVKSGVRQGDDLNLYMVGPPGWWSGDVKEFVDSSDMTDRVRRLGPPTRKMLPALFAGAEAFLFPSLAEGFGLPILEAMACGTPVITSDRSSLPEVAGSAAELCDPDDEHSIGGALAKVLNDAGLASDLRRLGLERARDFTWDRTARETKDVYYKALNGS